MTPKQKLIEAVKQRLDAELSNSRIRPNWVDEQERGYEKACEDILELIQEILPNEQ